MQLSTDCVSAAMYHKSGQKKQSSGDKLFIKVYTKRTNVTLRDAICHFSCKSHNLLRYLLLNS